MLLSKKAMTVWNRRTKKHYEEKGYKFTRMDDEFEVKVEDLTDGSHVKINVECDGEDCKNPYLKPMAYKNYVRLSKQDGKYYCGKCASKLYGSKSISKAFLIKNGISFEKWCLDNNRQDILDRWDYELNNCSPSEICYSANKKHWFKCSRGLHESELKNINNLTGETNAMNCNKCNSIAQWGIDNLDKDFLKKYWDYKLNKNIDPWDTNKRGNTKIWIKCQEKDYHESYIVVCSGFVDNNRCPYCKGFKVHPLDSLGNLLESKDLLNIWSEKNIKSPYECMPHNNEKAWWKCLNNDKHEDYERTITNSTKYDFRCPECVQERDESLLQEKVRIYLESLGYTILHEHKCTIVPINPKTNRPLPFDNEVKDLKLVIEVHGEQHYKAVYYFDKNSNLHKRQLYDRYKCIYAKLKDYNYIVIPYWTDNSKKEWKTLIDEEIRLIKNILSKNNYLSTILKECEDKLSA